MTNFLSLPSELNHCIAKLCPRGTLASLARTHSACQIEAEQALYHKISIVAYKKGYLKCLKTLAANLKKAGYVHALSVQSTLECDVHTKIVKRVLRGIINMHSLEDLRLKMFFQGSPETGKKLNDILCGDHFQLKILYCCFKFKPPSLDIPRLIKNHTDLQILVTDHTDDADELLPTLQQLHDLQLFPPMVATMEKSPEEPSQICIFPAFYSVDRIAMIHQVLVEFMDKDDDRHFYSLYIYLMDPSELATIHALAKEIAVSFPRIRVLALCFKDQREIPIQEVEEIATYFSGLHTLHFGLWRSGPNADQFHEDIKEPVIEWVKDCPQAFRVASTNWTPFCVTFRDDEYIHTRI